MSGSHLLVRVGETTAAVPALAVRRVVRALELHPLPGAGDGLLGLSEFGGEPIAVLDLARLLGVASASTAAPPVTVVAWIGPRAERELVGLAVDEALEVASLDGAAVAAGEALLRGETVRLVDVERLGETGP